MLSTLLSSVGESSNLIKTGESMIKLDDYELPAHISYSAFTTYLTCGYQYYLGRLLQLPEEPSVWSAGGRAFHYATELYDLENE
jgi:ATP-dependent helicase/DNAse subunit B